MELHFLNLIQIPTYNPYLFFLHQILTEQLFKALLPYYWDNQV